MVDQPLTSRGAATHRRIIEVATQEFAEHGIAGARVDRIVAAARTNKAQLYAYFGSKEGLFDAIFFSSLERIVNVVPIDATDLADWAVRLYDEYLRRPISSAWPPGRVWSDARQVTWSTIPTASTTTNCAPSPRRRPPAWCAGGTRST
ncbi:hypothetical protein SALBM311S_13040 [Streptomyces alboniger]